MIITILYICKRDVYLTAKLKAKLKLTEILFALVFNHDMTC